MRKLMIGLLVLAMAGVASANLLLNSSFETAGANQWTPQNWWRSDPGVYRQQSWGEGWTHDGDWNMRSEQIVDDNFWFGQDVTQNAALGDVATFSIYVLRQENNSFTTLDLKLEWVWDGGSATDSYSIRDAVLGQATWGWFQHTAVFTNSHNSGVFQVKPSVDCTDFAETLGSDNYLGFDSASLTVIPEPTAVALLGLGGLLAVTLRRKARK